MGALPTVRVDDGRGGFVIINASDFDPASHRLFVAAPAAPASGAAPFGRETAAVLHGTEDVLPSATDAPEPAKGGRKKSK